jgi:hypothetical protein
MVCCTIEIEAVLSSEMSVDSYQTALSHIGEHDLLDAYVGFYASRKDEVTIYGVNYSGQIPPQ